MKKRRSVLIVIFVIVLCAMLADKLIAAVSAGSKRLEEEIAISEKKLFNLKLALKQTDRLNLEYEKLISGKNSTAHSDNLLPEIEDIAARANVKILSIAPSVTRQEQEFKVYTINMESQGDITALSRFLRAITEDLRRVGAQRVRIDARKRDEPPRVFLSLNAVAFGERK